MCLVDDVGGLFCLLFFEQDLFDVENVCGVVDELLEVLDVLEVVGEFGKVLKGCLEVLLCQCIFDWWLVFVDGSLVVELRLC